MISDRLNGISATLERLGAEHFRIVPINDISCENAGAFVINKALPIYLCTGFWIDIYRRPATLIHEVSHLRGMNDEQYIPDQGFNLPVSSCIPRARFSIKPSQTVRNPDSYAYLCADVRAAS